MGKKTAIPYVSLRYVREGAVGVEGQLPPGWSGELLSLTRISRVDNSDAGPALTVHFEFSPNPDSDFISIVAGSFIHAAPSDVYLFGAEVELGNAENIGAGFILFREWEQNGPCVGQQVRTFSLTTRPSSALVACQIREPKRLLQPVFSFKRDRTKGGRGALTVRKMILSSIYECAEWWIG